MRRVLLATNVLLSALIFPGGVAPRALWRAANEDHLVLTEWILDFHALRLARPRILTPREFLDLG